eukprot:8073748-Karenia_brevis.AAC.1
MGDIALGARRAIHEKQKLGELSWVHGGSTEMAAIDPSRAFDEQLLAAAEWEQLETEMKMMPDAAGR